MFAHALYSPWMRCTSSSLSRCASDAKMRCAKHPIRARSMLACAFPFSTRTPSAS